MTVQRFNATYGRHLQTGPNTMDKYAFWNNKGGTGKTSLAFQVVCAYAHEHRKKRILVVDVCPQANLSELLLGGLVGGGSRVLLERQGATPRATIGGYFQDRLPSPFAMPRITAASYVTTPSAYNRKIPSNIDMICGDALLELQANAISTLANTQIPGTNTWIAVVNWLNDLLGELDEQYDAIFVDTNPSFSIYTQIALAAVQNLILPVMADDSSRRAIQNAFSLVHGLNLPSTIYSQHAFATKLSEASQLPPKAHLILKNRLTQYMGPASAYYAVLTSIDRDIRVLMKARPDLFTFTQPGEGIVEIRDFQTTGVVAFAKGAPFYELKPGYLEISGRRVRLNQSQLDMCVSAIAGIVTHL
jgi:cellulose biosynthesis protein BcsQ